MDQLRHFVTVIRVGSLTRAASIVNRTQPALSRQMQALEVEIGWPLMTRTAFGVEPTGYGLRLYQQAQLILDQIERIPEIIRAEDEGERLMRVGVPQGIPDAWGLAVLNRLAASTARIRLSLHEATTEEQRELLQKDLIDLGLIHVEAPELNCELLLQQRMGVAVPPDSLLSRRVSVTLADLDGLTVMAHAIGEVNAEVGRLQAASDAVEADTKWLFRRFSEHTRFIAQASSVDAVLMTEVSTQRHLPDWDWIAVEGHDVAGRDLNIRTWAAWRGSPSNHLTSTVEVMRAVSDATDWSMA